jgi:cytochrome P450
VERREIPVYWQATPNASIEMALYAMGLAASRRGKGGADLTTTAVNADIDGHTMTDAEFGSFFVQLGTAGNDTTRNLLASGTLALLEHWDALAALRADSSLLPAAFPCIGEPALSVVSART